MTAATADTRKSDFEGAKLAKRLRRLVGQAIADYSMIEAGDKVMACLSGGKDSYAMLDVLLSLQKRSPQPFTIVAVNLDQKQPGFPADVLPRYLAGRGVEFRIVEQDTYSVVKRLIPDGATIQTGIVGIPEGADQIRSFHPWGLLMDEAAFQPAAGEAYDAAVPVCQKIIVVSSAGPGWFADFVTDEL